MESFELPLFPLHAVLFPGGPLKLRIFEARYVDMIGRCMRGDEPFAVALIVEGREVGPARTASIGTSARITDFERLRDGLLGITARGERRFTIQTARVANDGLNMATLGWRAESVTPVPDEFAPIVRFVSHVYPHVSSSYGETVPALDEACWLSARAAELLPLSLPDRQTCLSLDDPVQRLEFLLPHLNALGEAGRFP